MACLRPLRSRLPTLGALALVLGALLASAAPARARQTTTPPEVRGSIVQADVAVPVQGAMVLLLDASGLLQGRVLSGRDGTFRLVTPQPGRYQLRVDRIGYASTYSDWFELVSGQPVQITIETDYQPIDLPGLLAEGTRRCEVRPTRGAAAAAWDEARKALEAAAWTSERGLYRFTSTRFVRDVDEDGRRVRREQRSTRTDFAAQVFQSVPAEILASQGFLQQDGTGYKYSAPDAMTLVSDPFLDTHCFELERREVEGERLVGLRFSPVPGRRLPEVTGVLWLGELTGRLRSIEYNYVNLPWQISTRDAGGEIRLRGLPNGTWIVQDWRIRMPMIVEERDEYGRARAHRVTGYVDEGGVVNVVATTAGEPVEWETGLGRVAGVVSDSVGRPTSKAVVRIEGTDFLAETDRNGRFTFEDVGVGVWTVTASSDALGRFGLPGISQDVEVARDATGNVTLALPSVRSAALEQCEPSDTPPNELTILVGRVVDSDGRPVPRASLRASWRYRPPAENPNAEQVLTQVMGASMEADQNGRFTLCGFPLRQEVRIIAVSGDRSSDPVDAAVQRPSEIASVEVKLPAGAQAAGPTGPGAPPRALSAEEQWLATKGYARRAGYALLHQTRRQFSQMRRDSLRVVLEQVPRIEAFQRADGIIEYRLHSSSQWAVRADPPDYCVLDFYLNGGRIQPGVMADLAISNPRPLGSTSALTSAQLTLDRWLDMRLVTAIEVFDALDVPAGSDSGCGAAFVWTHYLDDDADPDFDGFLRGRVTGLSEQQLATGVPVSVQPGGLRANLDRFGRFDFGALTAARYQVEIGVPDFGAWKTEAMIRAGGVVDLEIEVTALTDSARAQPVPGTPGAPAGGAGVGTPGGAGAAGSPIAMPGIEVAAEARVRFLEREGFYQRQRDGVGVRLAPEDIAQRQAERTQEIVRSIPGMVLFEDESFTLSRNVPCPRGWSKVGAACEPDGSMRRAPALLTRSGVSTPDGVPCVPAVFLDARIVQASGELNLDLLFDLDTVPASQLLAIEVFRGAAEVPARFSGGSSACGAVAIWTLASVPPN
jgi:hypothetical protein